MVYNIEFLNQWQLKESKIAIYCAGCVGIAIAGILKRCGIRIDCFVDNNCDKWDKIIVDDIKCFPPNILSGRNDYITFICVGKKYYNEILHSAHENKVLRIADFNDVLDDIIVNRTDLYLELIKEFENREIADYFYMINPNSWAKAGDDKIITGNKRIAVYTGIFGGYDKICIPQIQPENIDYYFISNEKPQELGCFKWIDAKEVVPDNITSPIKRNRYIKMHPHLIFSEYDYSIYVDGNIEIKEDISSFVNDNKSGISAFMHPERECTYCEGLTVVNRGLAKADEVIEQLNGYVCSGMPINYGLPEMMVIAREHKKAACIKIMEEWWKEYNRGCQRDQLSFMYVMWKNGMRLQDISSLGTDSRKCKKIILYTHSKKGEEIVSISK